MTERDARRWHALFALAPVLALSGAYAYVALFGQFSAHDDEGYVIQTVRLVLDGQPLFDETITCYGPFLYLWKWLLHGVLDVPLTNDVTRFVTLLFWTSTAAVLGWVAWRLTGWASLAVATQGLTFFHLTHSIFEPGHPQELCGLVVAVVVAVACEAKGRLATAIVAGAGAAALGFSKVNVGLFLAVSCLLASLADEPRRWLRSAWWGLAAFAVALPFLLMRPVLTTGWGLRFAAINGLGTLAALVVTRPRGGQGERFPMVAFLASGMVVAVVACGYALATGTSPYGLLDGIILTPLKVAGIFVWPARTRGFGVPLAMLGLVAAVSHARRPWPAWLLSLGRVALAVGVVAASVRTDAVTMVSAATGWLWLAVAGREPDRGRTMLVLVAVLQPLQAYPVPGSQFFFGTALYLVVAAVGLGDVLDRLVGWRVVRRAWPALVVVSILLLFTAKGRTALAAYRASVPLGPRQADRIRATEAQAATITWLVTNIGRHADTSVCNTGFNSLYLWTGKPAPTAAVIGSDINGLTPEVQAEVVAALEHSKRPVVIFHPPMMESLSRGEGRVVGPIERHVAEAYETVGRVGSYEFRVRLGRPAPELWDCGTWVGSAAIRLRLSPRIGVVAREAVLVDLEGGTILFRAAVATDPSGPDELTLTVPETMIGSSREHLGVRLLDGRGRWIVTVPVLTRSGRSDVRDEDVDALGRSE